MLHTQGLNRMFINIHRTIKRYKNPHSISDRKRSGRPKTATTQAMVRKVTLRIKRNAKRFMRKMAKDMKISDGSMRNIVKNCLKLKTIKHQHAHQLIPQTKEDASPKMQDNASAVQPKWF